MSTFSFAEFYRHNRRVLIWAAFFTLAWLLRDFFGLVFLTFVLAFVAARVTDFVHRRVKLSPRVALCAVYLLFLGTLAGLVSFIVPSVAIEVNRLIGNLPSIEQRLIETKTQLTDDYPELRQPFNGFLRSALPDDRIAGIDQTLTIERMRLGLGEESVEAALDAEATLSADMSAYLARQDLLLLNALMDAQFARVRTLAPDVITWLYRAMGTLLLALLFSFLLLLDLRSIKDGVQRLKQSRAADFYDVMATPLVRFGILVARAIEAQGMIAVVNTLMTVLGLLLLDIPLLAVLSFIVFMCSFIPVLGVFISTTPIVLVALNAGGLALSIWVIVLVSVIHVVEAYMLNPLIYGKHLRMNPVLTLVILYVGYHAFGLWGMLLGVPVTRYFLHDVLALGLKPHAEARPGN